MICTLTVGAIVHIAGIREPLRRFVGYDHTNHAYAFERMGNPDCRIYVDHSKERAFLDLHPIEALLSPQ